MRVVRMRVIDEVLSAGGTVGSMYTYIVFDQA